MLTLTDYYRMECATVACPACGSVRGQRCKGKNVAYYAGSGHTDRKNVFRAWAKRNPEAYARLRLQIEVEKQPVIHDLYMGEN